MKVTKQLILDHFDRKTSPLQRERIGEWVKDEANEERYYAWLEEWERTHQQYEAPVDPAIARYGQFMDANPPAPRFRPAETTNAVAAESRRGFWSRWLPTTMAAATLVLGMTGWLYRDQLIYESYRTAYGEIKTVTLTDGSSVKLNTNSVLRVPRWTFGRRGREVFLDGEASFSVTHTADDQKFVVHTPENFDVVVLGTEFTLYARPHNARVVLEKGKVRVRYQEANQHREITMHPGELVKFDRTSQVRLSTTQRAEQYAEWEEKRFIFEETTLRELAYQLQDTYGLNVVVTDESLAQREFMGSFRAKDVDELLLILSELLDVRVSRQGNRVEFSGK